MKTCPACGHPIHVDEIAEQLPRRKRKLYEIVLESGTVGISTQHLMVELYDDDPSGGPSSSAIKAHVSQINHTLRRHGVAIRGVREHRSDPGMWRLVKI